MLWTTKVFWNLICQYSIFQGSEHIWLTLSLKMLSKFSRWIYWDNCSTQGLIIKSAMKWVSNTSNKVPKGNERLWIKRCLKKLGAKEVDLVKISTKQIRVVLELAFLAWQGGIRGWEATPWENSKECLPYHSWKWILIL